MTNPESQHLDWIQKKQKEIERAQAAYELKKSIAKEARENVENLIGELLQFIADLRNGQEALNFDEGGKGSEEQQG